MELLALFFIWPFLILSFGLVFIAFEDLVDGSGVMLLFLAAIAILILLARSRNAKPTAEHTNLAQLKELRRMVVVLSIAALLPIFLRYLFDSFEQSLPVTIAGLVIGFGFMLWGMFEKGNRVITYANLLGGGIVVIFTYSQLWELGGAARVIAAAFGLVVAVVVSTIKLKDKLS